MEIVYRINGEKFTVAIADLERKICFDCPTRTDFMIYTAYEIANRYADGKKDNQYINLGEISKTAKNAEEEINDGIQITTQERGRLKEIVRQCHACGRWPG